MTKKTVKCYLQFFIIPVLTKQYSCSNEVCVKEPDIEINSIERSKVFRLFVIHILSKYLKPIFKFEKKKKKKLNQ